MNNQATPIKIGAKVIGYVHRSVFRKNVQSSKHFLRNPPGIASDVDALLQSVAAGADEIRLLDTDTGVKYRTTIKHLLECGENLNRRHGAQLFLPMIHWETMMPHGSREWRIQHTPCDTVERVDFHGRVCVRFCGDPKFPDGKERYPMCHRPSAALQQLNDGSVNFYCRDCAKRNQTKNAVTLATKP